VVDLDLLVLYREMRRRESAARIANNRNANYGAPEFVAERKAVFDFERAIGIQHKDSVLKEARRLGWLK